MDGLDIEEIYKSNLENSFTIGAEYYGKRFVNAANCVKKINHKTLQEISDIITDGDHGSSNYQQSGVLYLLSESVHQGYIDILKCRYISEEKNKELHRSELHPNDIVVTKTGVYFGKSAVITNKIEKANMIAHVGKISLKNGYNPFFVSSFLNCKYGYYQLRRRGIKATRPEIKLVEFSDIIVPVFSGVIEHCIEEIINKALQLMDFANSIIKQCENDIALCVAGKNCIVSCNYAIKPFSKTFELTGRLDAEYYQPKYDLIVSSLNTQETLESICNLYDENYLPDEEKYYRYIELANVGGFGEITETDSIVGEELPTRARRIVKTGQVIVSSIEGSLQSCALITDELDGALCSTGFYVVDSEKLNSETLLVLFKSDAIQALMKQRCSGTILTSINKDEFLTLPFPEIEEDIQIRISEQVKESFALRRKSKQLLEDAKRAVEIAIEQDEESAIEWLKDRKKEAGV